MTAAVMTDDDRVCDACVGHDRNCDDHISEDRISSDCISNDCVGDDCVSDDCNCYDRVGVDCVNDNEYISDDCTVMTVSVTVSVIPSSLMT